MGEHIISLSWDRLDSLLAFADRRLAAQGFPTILRLRVQMVLEELFSSALATPGAQSARMRCSLPAPNTLLIQCRSAQPDFSPDWGGVKVLDGEASTYGLKLTVDANACTILVGQR